MKKKPLYFVHPKALVESGTIGAGTRVWGFSHVMPGVFIGKGCNVGEQCFIESGSSLGDRVTVKNGVSVWDGVRLENDVFVGPAAAFTNDPRPISRKQPVFKKTLVKKGACIGANATILCGIRIGSYAFVGAGAVVTKNVPDHALVYGNPARVQGFLCRCRQALKFKGQKASCACGDSYKKSGGSVEPV